MDKIPRNTECLNQIDDFRDGILITVINVEGDKLAGISSGEYADRITVIEVVADMTIRKPERDIVFLRDKDGTGVHDHEAFSAGDVKVTELVSNLKEGVLIRRREGCREMI